MSAKIDTQEKLFEKIQEAAGSLDGYNPAAQADVLRDLAAAYRMVAGGAQPGGVFVEGKG